MKSNQIYFPIEKSSRYKSIYEQRNRSTTIEQWEHNRKKSFKSPRGSAFNRLFHIELRAKAKKVEEAIMKRYQKERNND